MGQPQHEEHEGASFALLRTGSEVRRTAVVVVARASLRSPGTAGAEIAPGRGLLETRRARRNTKRHGELHVEWSRGRSAVRNGTFPRERSDRGTHPAGIGGWWRR